MSNRLVGRRCREPAVSRHQRLREFMKSLSERVAAEITGLYSPPWPMPFYVPSRRDDSYSSRGRLVVISNELSIMLIFVVKWLYLPPDAHQAAPIGPVAPERPLSWVSVR